MVGSAAFAIGRNIAITCIAVTRIRQKRESVDYSNGMKSCSIWIVLALMAVAVSLSAAATVSTLIGTGTPGFSDNQVANPYGLVIGPDGALYFCDLDNQRIRRLDLATKRTTVIAGNGERGYRGDGGPAINAALNMPHEIRFDGKGDLYIAERDNHVVRKVDMKTGVISTAAGTGTPGFSGDGGPGAKAQLRQPHSILFDRDGSLLICDIANQRIRRLHMDTGIIETYAGTGEAKPSPDGAPIRGTPLNGPAISSTSPIPRVM